MPAFLIFAFFIFLTAISSGSADAATCPRGTVVPAIGLDSSFAEPHYDHTFSRRDIAAMSGLAALPGSMSAGLTRGRYEVTFQISVRVQPLRGQNGGACVTVTGVDARFAYMDLNVFIASEFVPGSCQYNVVLDHENRHVEINRGVFNKYRPKVRYRLEQAVRDMHPFWVPKADGAARAAADRLHKALAPLRDQMDREMKAANSVIDTPESYRREARRCAEW